MEAGARRREGPDFLLRLANGTILALEITGSVKPPNKAKWHGPNERGKAANAARGFGLCAWDDAFKPCAVEDIIARHAAIAAPAE